MSQIKVTFGALSTAQADIRSTLTRINGMLEELEAGLRPIAATWQGEAALFHREKQQQWNTAAVDIGVVLDQIGRAVGTANDNYQQVENRNRSLWV